MNTLSLMIALSMKPKITIIINFKVLFVSFMILYVSLVPKSAQYTVR